MPGSDCEWVDEADAGLIEVGAVARDNDQAVDQSGGGDQAVFDRHGAPCSAKICEQLCPPHACFCFPRQAMKPLNARVEPPLETGAPFPLAQQQNAESQLAEDYGIDGQFTLVPPEPLDHLGNGRLLGRLAQHVGVDQIPHSSSVDPDSTGTKKPFAGHASNQSTTPSFGGAKRRVRRYSPRSSRSTSNSWPASIRSCRRLP